VLLVIGKFFQLVGFDLQVLFQIQESVFILLLFHVYEYFRHFSVVFFCVVINLIIWSTSNIINMEKEIRQAVLEKRWEQIKKAQEEQVTRLCFHYVCDFLDLYNTSTGEAIVSLEKRLRENDVPVWCMAVPTISPLQSCTYHKVPTDYHLYLHCGDPNTLPKEYNNSRDVLLRCGFLNDETKEKTEKRRAQACKLPEDIRLPAEKCRVICPLFHELITKHCESMLQGKWSDVLRFKEIQCVRTSIPTSRWKQAKPTLLSAIDNRIPLAESTVLATLKEQLIPVGIHLLGFSLVDGDDCAIIDLYTIQERKYHIALSPEEYAFVHDNHSADIDKLRSLLARAALVPDEEVVGITFDNWQRHFSITAQ
jgi:hypothetical protein